MTKYPFFYLVYHFSFFIRGIVSLLLGFSTRIFSKNPLKKFQVHTAVNTSSRWKRFYTKTMIRVFNKGVKGRGGGPWSSIFKEGEGVKGTPPYISVYYY